MRQSVIKIGIDNFLDKIKFDKKYYETYNNVLNEKIDFTYDIFIYFILQVAYQNKFHGYFDELYVDIIKRKSDYIRELIINFKISFLGPPTTCDRFYKFFCFWRGMSDREIFFYRKLTIFELEKSIDNVFQLKNEANLKKFIEFCEIIYKSKMNEEFDSKIETKIKKKVSFKLSTKS